MVALTMALSVNALSASREKLMPNKVWKVLGTTARSGDGDQDCSYRETSYFYCKKPIKNGEEFIDSIGVACEGGEGCEIGFSGQGGFPVMGNRGFDRMDFLHKSIFSRKLVSNRCGLLYFGKISGFTRSSLDEPDTYCGLKSH